MVEKGQTDASSLIGATVKCCGGRQSGGRVFNFIFVDYSSYHILECQEPIPAQSEKEKESRCPNDYRLRTIAFDDLCEVLGTCNGDSFTAYP